MRDHINITIVEGVAENDIKPLATPSPMAQVIIQTAKNTQLARYEQRIACIFYGQVALKALETIHQGSTILIHGEVTSYDKGSCSLGPQHPVNQVRVSSFQIIEGDCSTNHQRATTSTLLPPLKDIDPNEANIF
jgi:hypothetical protein